jgi:hypothetical protein
MSNVSYTRKTFTVLILVLSLVISATSGLGVAVSLDKLLFSDDFENYKADSFPSQWTLVFNGKGNQYQQVITDPLNSSNKCFQLQGERNWAADAVRYFQSNLDIIGFEVSVLVTANTGISGDDVKVGLWKQVNWGQAKWTDGVAFTDNGTIVARDFVEAEGTGTVLQTYIPGVWYHIQFVLDRPNRVISVFIDGVLKGESIKGSNLPFDFDGFAVSGRYTEVPVDYDNVRIFEASSVNICQELSLTTSCISSSSLSDFKVQIKGNLTLNETGISEAPILLSYSVNGGKSWVDLTLVQTGSDGSFYAEWMPSVTGYYSLKAVYEGNENYSDASTIVNFAVEPFQEQNVFSVNSNSTLTELSFNSNSRELSFNVSGDSGTMGYVNVYIPKSLVSNMSTLKIYLDDNLIEYSSQSQADGWLLYFTYHHSTHLVNISLDSSSTLLPTQVLVLGSAEIVILLFMGILSAVTILVAFVAFRKKTPSKNSEA